MGMKLLPKSEIDRQKAVEQRTAVEEGLKLARRVDNLREVAADTEASFKKHRDTTIAKINEEIGLKTKEKAELDTQIQTRKEELVTLQKPLDEEWVKVRAASIDVDTRAESADAKEHLLKDRAREIEREEKKVAATLARAQTREELATSTLHDADTATKEAKLALETAQRIKSEAVALKNKTHQELMHRDLMATGRERSVTLREQRASEREAENSAETIRLADMRSTLERALNRIKK